jgi:hypothetical protein
MPSPAIPEITHLQNHPLARTATVVRKQLAINHNYFGDSYDFITRACYLVNRFGCSRNTLPALTPKMLLPCASDVTSLPSKI